MDGSCIESGVKPFKEWSGDAGVQDGCTPMRVARQLGHRSVVTLLIISDRTHYRVRLPPLHIAADRDDVRAASLLLHQQQQSPTKVTHSSISWSFCLYYCFTTTTTSSSHQPRSHSLVSYDLSVFIANASYIFISISKDFALLPVCSKLLHKPIQWHMANLTPTSRKPLNHANANCLQEFVHKNVQNIHHFQGHMPEDAFFTGQLQCQ